MKGVAHKATHQQLHGALDELAADFVNHTASRLSRATVLDLIEWSYSQTLEPTEKDREEKTCIECERLRTQLAGCSVAALGGIPVAWKGSYGWSPAYQDVLDLREKYEVLQRWWQEKNGPWPVDLPRPIISFSQGQRVVIEGCNPALACAEEKVEEKVSE